MFSHFTTQKLVLASNSPRRKKLLKKLKIPFETKIKDIPEEFYPAYLTKEKIPEFLAVKKASFYSDEISLPGTILITADTIVLCDDIILGKPGNYTEAYKMLEMLSGKSHEVITGVALTSVNKQKVFHSVTKVYFKNLTKEEIDFYIKNYKPYDKAGAYGIQEWIGMIGIERIEGSYFNVVGLPVQKLYTELLKF